MLNYRRWYIFIASQIFITESIRSGKNLDEEHHEEVKLFKFTISPWFQNVYKFIGVFLIGTASCQLLTDIGKYSVGRFRPHFLTVSIGCLNLLFMHYNYHVRNMKILIEIMSNFFSSNVSEWKSWGRKSRWTVSRLPLSLLL